jgi:excisionase family DNA binding protein
MPESARSESAPPTMLQCEWLTAAEAALHLKVKRRTLLQWVREGKVPAHRLSGTKRCVWRFLTHEIDAMLMPSSAVAA